MLLLNSAPKKENMCAVGNRTLGVALPELVGAHIASPVPKMTRLCLQEIIFALLGFDLALVQSFLADLWYFPFRMEAFTLCHCMLDVYDFLSDVIGTNKSLP